MAMCGKFYWETQVKNIGYQGKMLGPPLLNMFCAEAAGSVNVYNVRQLISGSNLNCFQEPSVGLANLSFADARRELRKICIKQ